MLPLTGACLTSNVTQSYTQVEGNVRSHLSYRSKKELLLQIAPRYREASPALKTVILDEFVAATGYVRKYAISAPESSCRTQTVDRASTATLLWTRGTASIAPGVDSSQSHLCQASDSVLANPSGVVGAAWASPSERGMSGPAPRDKSGGR